MRKITGTLALPIVTTIIATSAQTATATTLCDMNESPCPTGHAVKTVHFKNNTTMQVLFAQFDKPVNCLSALLAAEVFAGSPLTLHTTSLVFGSCKFVTQACAVWTEELPNFSLALTGENLGSLVATGGDLHTCELGILKYACVFGLEGLELPMEGVFHGKESGNGMITSEKRNPEASPFCQEATLDLLLEPSESIYIVS